MFLRQMKDTPIIVEIKNGSTVLKMKNIVIKNAKSWDVDQTLKIEGDYPVEYMEETNQSDHDSI